MARTRPRGRRLPIAFDLLDDRCLLSGLTPAQVAQAYALNNITFRNNGQTVTGDGTGQTIAIVVAFHDPNLVHDLGVFDQTEGLPTAQVTQVDQAGGATDDGWAGEESLDVEWAHAIAPGAKILVVEAPSDTDANMFAAVSYARSLPGVSVVSMSWGDTESQGEQANDAIFTTPAGHTGITFVAASGDNGPSAGSDYPASSPNVLTVGGTTLQTDAAGNNLGESLWSLSGRGTSVFEPVPSYQMGLVTGGRTEPDVSFDGDPNTGVGVYTTAPSNGTGSWEVVGGTSLGTPAWAGIIAIADQGRVAAGLGTLDGATQTLTALYSLPRSDFNAVTVHGATQAGYSAASGLGTPNGASLIAGLVAFGQGSSTTPTGGGGTPTGGGGGTAPGGGTTIGGGGGTPTGGGGGTTITGGGGGGMPTGGGTGGTTTGTGGLGGPSGGLPVNNPPTGGTTTVPVTPVTIVPIVIAPGSWTFVGSGGVVVGAPVGTTTAPGGTGSGPYGWVPTSVGGTGSQTSAHGHGHTPVRTRGHKTGGTGHVPAGTTHRAPHVVARRGAAPVHTAAVSRSTPAALPAGASMAPAAAVATTVAPADIILAPAPAPLQYAPLAADVVDRTLEEMAGA